MNIFFANNSRQTIGGGWTFLSNIKKGLGKEGGVRIVADADIADVYFITSSSMVNMEEVLAAAQVGKKIVLRVDNVPRNSRNRNTGTSRLKTIAGLADLIIYQSEWARGYLNKWLNPENKKKVAVIYNGVDNNIFKPEGDRFQKQGRPQYLYVRYNRDETKNWHEAWYFSQNEIMNNNAEAHLWIVGNFSPELVEYNFDFFAGAEERYKFWGAVQDKELMAMIYRSADILLIPFFNDACSNTYLEARSSGIKIFEFLSGGYSGGTPELAQIGLPDNLWLEKMAQRYFGEINKII